MASLYRNLETATGRSIDEWAALGRATGIDKHKALVEHIKLQHGLTHGYAHQIALRTLAADSPDSGTVDLIAEQYSGAKAAQRPLYDAVAEAIGAFGEDIDFSPKKAYVSLRRSKQFGLLQPAAGRLDIGLTLKGLPATDRLEASGSFNSMVTHRVRLHSLQEIDADLLGWLRAAYDAA